MRDKKKLTPRQKELKAEKRLKKRLEKEADRLWHIAVMKRCGNKCFFHNSGKEAKQHQTTTEKCHHFFAKGLYPNLRYEVSNGVPVCWPCHYKLEKVDRSMIADIISWRGKKWYESLKAKALTKPKPSFQTVSYYQQVIKQLEK